MKRAATVAVLAACLLAIFWRLDGVPLWRDEATTAVWGRLMAEAGTPLPYAYDFRAGQLLVQDDDGHDVNSRLLPAMQSYLQFYVSAAGHAVLGSSTLAARLPFALFGLGALALLYWLGRICRGPGWLPVALPLSACASIYFLHAARQGRYYILVVFAAALLMVWIARYLRDPHLGVSWKFHAQLSLIGCLLYGANYVSFAATWLALGLFFLLTDRSALWRLCCTSSVLAVVLGAEFWLLHAEYLTAWRPGGESAVWDSLRHVVATRGADYWRWVPFAFLLPAAALASQPIGGHRFSSRSAPIWLASALPLAGLVIGERTFRDAPAPAFLLGCAAFLGVPAAAFALWRRIERPGVRAKLALFAGLIVTVCPLFTILVAGRGTLPRYYYQTCPAAVVLVGLAAASLWSGGRKRASAVCLAASSLWPNLDLAAGGTEQVVLRQMVGYDEHNGPLLDFLSTFTQPGDTIAFFRNVKGMVASFYLPDRRWVNQLDVDVRYNRRFRGRIPDDQFDDSPDPDWFVLWDERGRVPKALDSRYELVWEHSYQELRGWWDAGRTPRERSYKVYRLRRSPA